MQTSHREYRRNRKDLRPATSCKVEPDFDPEPTNEAASDPTETEVANQPQAAVEDQNLVNEDQHPYVTHYGRQLKKPDRLDL